MILLGTIFVAIVAIRDAKRMGRLLVAAVMRLTISDLERRFVLAGSARGRT